MKKLFTSFVSILFIFSILFIQSCKDESVTEPEPNPDEIKIPGTTKTLNETDYTTYLKEISSDSTTFTFYSTSNTKFDFKVDDVICIAVGEGMLRKITSVNKTGDEVKVETTQASLADAIETGKVTFSEVLPEPLQKDLPKGIKYLGKKLYKDGKQQTFTFSIEQILFDEDNNNNTTEDQIKVTGSLEIGSTITGEIDFGFYSIDRFELAYVFTEGTSLNLTVGSVNTPIDLFSYEFPAINFPTIIIYVGSLPVIITPQLIIKTGSEIELYAELEAGVVHEINYNVGFIYENENWSTFKDVDTTFSVIPPTITAGVTAKVFLTPDLQFKIYGTVSPNLEAELYGKAVAQINLPNPDLDIDIFAGLKIDGGVKMEVFDVTIIDFSYTFFDFVIPIYHYVFTVNTPPDPPTLFSPSNGATNVGLPPTITWNASSGATSYTLQVSTNSSFTSFVYNQSGLTGTSQQVTGLNNSIKYYWRVSATNNYGTSGWSSVWNFTTAAGGTAPQPPTLSSPSNGATNVGLPPTLTWNASSGATSYTLQVSTNSSFTSFVYNQSGLIGTSQQVTGLNNSIKYYWRVSATNNYGTSGWSSVWNFTTAAGGTAPQPPTLSSPSNGATNVSLPPALVWNVSSSATSYTLQVSTNSNFTSFVYNQSGLTGTSQQVTGLNNSIKYYWRVSATNTYGTSGWSSVWNFTTAAGGTAPQPPTLSSPSNGATNVSLPPGLVWNVSSGATSYTLQVSTNSNFTSFVYNQSGLTSTSQQISGLNNSTTYYWRVSATNSYGTSGWSSVWNFTTEIEPCPGTVTYEGKTYNTVQIGDQCWLRENLDVGTRIDGIQSASDNGVIEKYCYDDNPANCETYGGLYQWNEAMQYVTNEGAQGICPDGWHLPTYAEFQTLIIEVGGDGNALKEIGQGTGGGAGTNTSGFSALLAGYRYYVGYFFSLGDYAGFWSSSEIDGAAADHLGLLVNDYGIGQGNYPKEGGFSVRCVKD